MKVCSVNIAAGPGWHINNLANQIINGKIAINLNRMCSRLDTPDAEFYNVFSQLKSHSITKTPQDKIIVELGGVVGDKHFNPPVSLEFNQISILTIERYRVEQVTQ